MEAEKLSEKTSYTLNHTEDESDANKTETYEPINPDEEPAETDKMISKPAAEENEKAKSTEILAEVDETTALAEKEKEAIKEESQTKPPIKTRILQLFERKKKPEPTESQNGVASPTEAEESALVENQNPPKRRIVFPSIKIGNPFAKKQSEPTALIEEPVDEADTETKEKPAPEATPDGEEKKDEASTEEKKTETKFNPLASINLPKFSGLLSRFRRTQPSEDIELGNGRKAGLASQETLDDSTKDPWNQEGDAVDAEKPADPEQPEKGDEEKKETFIENIRSYNCSIDDIALIVGVLVFLILVALILAFSLLGTTKQTIVAPIRNGKVIASTSCGPVEGLVEDSAIAFRGIPYAKPPIGGLRFENAQIIDDIQSCWNGTLEAHNSTEECIQVTKGVVSGIENCLTLDIVTPVVRYINLLPVVVMVGANDYLGGSPGNLRPSSRYARQRDVVFVRPHFRLNVFGFLALETISNSSERAPTSGNYALSDIIAALEWIQINIRNFGGDPSLVTLFGHKTGATLVTALTSSSKAKKLFARAWAASPSARFPGKTLSEYEKENADYEKSITECKKDRLCLNNSNAQTLVEKIPNSWTSNAAISLPGVNEDPSKVHEFLVTDGKILKKHPQEVWKNDKDIASRLVIGTTAHISYSNKSFNFNMTGEEVQKIVSDSLIGSKNLTEEAIKLYGDSVQGLIQMISDIRYVCPLLVIARANGNSAFYIVTQPRGAHNLADGDFDIQAILGRINAEDTPKRRYLDSIRPLFYHFVSNGRVKHYTKQNFVLNIGQDVIVSDNYKNCDFWIQNDLVPHFAAV